MSESAARMPDDVAAQGRSPVSVAAIERVPPKFAAVSKLTGVPFSNVFPPVRPEYGFGPQLDITRPMTAREAARYLAGYLLGRSKRKGTIRDNLADPRMPRCGDDPRLHEAQGHGARLTSGHLPSAA